MKVRNEMEQQKGTRERMICLYVYVARERARERRVRERKRESDPADVSLRGTED